MSENKPLFKITLSDIAEFIPEKPVSFDPPKVMYVWDDDDANSPDTAAPYLAEVFYVNPRLGVKRVFAHGDGMAAQNAGTTWDHCAETTGTGALYAHAHLEGRLPDVKEDDSVIKIFSEGTECKHRSSEVATYRELSKWLSKGNGQVMIARVNDFIIPPCYSNTISYPKDYDNKPVPWSRTAGTGETYYKVRKYDDEQFVDPTREYMDLDKKSVAVLDSAVEVPESVKYNLGQQPGQCFHHLVSTPDWSTVVDEGNHG